MYWAPEFKNRHRRRFENSPAYWNSAHKQKSQYRFLRWLIPSSIAATLLYVLAYHAIFDPSFSWTNLFSGLGAALAVLLTIWILAATLIMITWLLRRRLDAPEEAARERMRSRWQISVGRRKRS